MPPPDGSFRVGISPVEQSTADDRTRPGHVVFELDVHSTDFALRECRQPLAVIGRHLSSSETVRVDFQLRLQRVRGRCDQRTERRTHMQSTKALIHLRGAGHLQRTDLVRSDGETHVHGEE